MGLWMIKLERNAYREDEGVGVLEIEISNNSYIDRIILFIDRSQYSVIIYMTSTYLL
jgi:hypothetical protein